MVAEAALTHDLPTVGDLIALSETKPQTLVDVPVARCLRDSDVG
jgi:hypothetical protein